MTTPCLRAVSMISSSARPTTVLPLSLNSIGIVAACWVLSRSIANALLRELVRKVLHHAEQRVRRRLAEAADRGIRHRLGELVEQRLVPLRSAISVSALAVPTRHGVHCPQDSSRKNRIRFRAASTARSRSERITTAAEPMKQPYLFNVSKSSGMSAIAAGRIPPDAPPGR